MSSHYVKWVKGATLCQVAPDYGQWLCYMARSLPRTTPPDYVKLLCANKCDGLLDTAALMC